MNLSARPRLTSGMRPKSSTSGSSCRRSPTAGRRGTKRSKWQLAIRNNPSKHGTGQPNRKAKPAAKAKRRRRKTTTKKRTRRCANTERALTTIAHTRRTIMAVKKANTLHPPQTRNPQPAAGPMPVKAHVYRAVAELNAGFETVILEFGNLKQINYFRSDRSPPCTTSSCGFAPAPTGSSAPSSARGKGRTQITTRKPKTLPLMNTDFTDQKQTKPQRTRRNTKEELEIEMPPRSGKANQASDRAKRSPVKFFFFQLRPLRSTLARNGSAASIQRNSPAGHGCCHRTGEPVEHSPALSCGLSVRFASGTPLAGGCCFISGKSFPAPP